MSLKKAGFFIFACLLASLAACGKDTPQEPDDSLPADTTRADTTGADTTGIDTAASKTPYLIPLAPGASWRYSLHFQRIIIVNSEVRQRENHYGEYSLEVVTADLENKTFMLRGRFKLDSLTIHSVTMNEWQTIIGDTTYTLLPGLDVLPVNPDTSYTLNIVTLRDTAYYVFGQDLHFFMPWSIEGLRNIKIDLRLMEYPWENELSYAAGICGKYESEKPFSYGICGFVPYGNIGGQIIPDSGGVTDFSGFYSPGYISHTEEYLTYKLLEYTPGSP